MLTGNMTRKLNQRALESIRKMETKGLKLNYSELERKIEQQFKTCNATTGSFHMNRK